MQHIFINIRLKIRHFLAVAGGYSLHVCPPPSRIGIAVSAFVFQNIHLEHKLISKIQLVNATFHLLKTAA